MESEFVVHYATLEEEARLLAIKFMADPMTKSVELIYDKACRQWKIRVYTFIRTIPDIEEKN